MNAYERRVVRLEDQAAAAATLENCSCSSRPAIAITCTDSSRMLMQSQEEANAALAFTCEVHGAIGPANHVRIVNPIARRESRH